MTTGGRDRKSDTSTRSAAREPHHDWAEDESAYAPPSETARNKAERELRRHLARSLRDRRRTKTAGTADTAPPAVTTASYPALAIQRPFPVTLYLGMAEGHQQAQEALGDLLTAFDFEVVVSLPPLRGSWYRDFIAVSRRVLTSRELGERLQKVERSIELQILHKHQAEIDSMQGDAVAKLLTALEHTPDALVQIGSVLLVKVDGTPAVRNLTQVELTFLEHNPKLLRSPATILEALQTVDQRAQLVD